MKTQNMSMKAAYDFVKEKRPCIGPNLHFMGQLLEMEKSRNNALEKSRMDSPAEMARSDFVNKLTLSD